MAWESTPTAVDEDVMDGLFVGILDLSTGRFEASLLPVSPKADEGESSKEPELLRLLTRFAAKHGPAHRLHLPKDYDKHHHYFLAKRCADRLDLPVVNDMLPSYFIPDARAGVDVLKLALRRSPKKGTQASVPSVEGQAWIAK